MPNPAPNSAYLIGNQNYTFVFSSGAWTGTDTSASFISKLNASGMLGVTISNPQVQTQLFSNSVGVSFVYSGGPGNRIEGFGAVMAQVLSNGLLGGSYTFTSAYYGNVNASNPNPPPSNTPKYLLYAGLFIAGTAFLFALGRGIGGNIGA